MVKTCQTANHPQEVLKFASEILINSNGPPGYLMIFELYPKVTAKNVGGRAKKKN